MCHCEERFLRRSNLLKVKKIASPKKQARNDTKLAYRVSLIFVVIIFSGPGCAGLYTPRYIQDKNPYKREIYAGFKETLAAARQALQGAGLTIADTVDPSDYEQTTSRHAQEKQTLIFTQPKRTSLLFLFPRSLQLNVYLREIKNATEVEIRYSSVSRVLFKSSSYKNDRFVDQIYRQINESLEK